MKPSILKMVGASPEIEKYLLTRAIKGPWKILGNEDDHFAGAVIIPALAEVENIWATLASLAQNPPDLLAKFLILVVVNHRQDDPREVKRNNWLTLSYLAERKDFYKSLPIGWVDAASPGWEFPKKGGVGLARKIGFDLALMRLNYKDQIPLLISLDADTLVRPDYLSALVSHFQNTSLGGAVIPFCHQKGATPEEDLAIKKYELFLRSYVFGLNRAGSPYAFHCIGSTMAFTAIAYIKAGGMNTRSAGEDFYFLQQLAKTSGIAQVKGTVVYPAARPSWRVPFGTGKSVLNLLTTQSGALRFYQTACFQALQNWLELVKQNLTSPGEEIQKRAQEKLPELENFLDKIHFQDAWNKLQKNYPSQQQLLSAFHVWFDGFKTRQFIHYLSSGPFPRKEPEEVLPSLFSWGGLASPRGSEAQLGLLRKIQIGEEY